MKNPREHSDATLQVPLEVVGLVPAAGMAKRLQPFPCSKEVYPVGFGHFAQTWMFHGLCFFCNILFI